MLRGSSLSTATVSVVRAHTNPLAVLHALGESRGSDTIQVFGHQDGTDPLALTLDIYVQSQHETTTIATATSQALYEKPDAMPIFARKCSWVILQQLRTDVLQVVHNDENRHCKQCAQIAEFLEHGFERPAVFDRTWGGAMVLSAAKVTHFVNTLLRLVCALPKEIESEDHPNEVHEKAVTIVSSFLVPDWKKTE